MFPSVRRPGSPLTERAVNFIVKEAAERAGVNPAASIHWLRDTHASHAIDNGGSHHARIGDARARGPEDHQRLCARPTWRKQRPIFEDEGLGAGSKASMSATALPNTASVPWSSIGKAFCTYLATSHWSRLDDYRRTLG